MNAQVIDTTTQVDDNALSCTDQTHAPEAVAPSEAGAAPEACSGGQDAQDAANPEDSADAQNPEHQALEAQLREVGAKIVLALFRKQQAAETDKALDDAYKALPDGLFVLEIKDVGLFVASNTGVARATGHLPLELADPKAFAESQRKGA